MQAHAFELIFAFDEVVALGYSENQSVSQVRSFTEMDSHEERIQEMIARVRLFAPGRVASWRDIRNTARYVCTAAGRRLVRRTHPFSTMQNKEVEAKEQAKLRIKQMDMQRREAQRQSKMGGGRSPVSSTGFGNTGGYGGGGGGGSGGGTGGSGGGDRRASGYGQPQVRRNAWQRLAVAGIGRRATVLTATLAALNVRAAARWKRLARTSPSRPRPSACDPRVACAPLARRKEGGRGGLAECGFGNSCG